MKAGRAAVVMAIAGSDSGGGAGIAADLRAFAALGVHGTTAITAITAQNTLGVSAIHPVPPEVIVAQVRAVVEDIGIDAVKVGMLGTADVVAAVAEALDLLGSEVAVVVDPVIVSESGAELLDPAARAALVELILPRADVITPNLLEARRLCNHEDGSSTGQVELAAELRRLGPGAVIVTGGHAAGVDVLDDGGSEPLLIAGEVHPDGAAHGSGCTHSSGLTALLALGFPLREAAAAARRFAGEAVRRGRRDLGAGPGPVDALGIAPPGLPGEVGARAGDAVA